MVRFGAFQAKMNCLKDGWFKFDSILVTMMVTETWLLPIILAGQSGEAMSNFALLKMMRLLRLTRMVRLMRSVPELVTLLKGMAIAARSVSYTLLLLLIFMYIFSIIFKSQLMDTENQLLKESFNQILISMWTLLLSGCLLDDISVIADLLVEESIFLAMIFILFVLLSSLMVLNMLIGVLCAVVTAVAAAEKEKVLVGYVKTKLITVLQRLDEDGNGTISKAEFDQLVHIPEAVQALDELGVDVPNLVSLSDHLFEAEDSDKIKSSQINSDEDADYRRSSGATAESAESGQEEEDVGVMTFADFLEMVIRLRAENTPSVADIVDLRKLIFKGQRQVAKRMHQIEKGQADLKRGVRLVSQQLDTALRMIGTPQAAVKDKHDIVKAQGDGQALPLADAPQFAVRGLSAGVPPDKGIAWRPSTAHTL
eukprot:gnl/TRDRNA2_/TRDRNA2_85459_c0_seq1.p1 gnl/TRDRNA2_/TRDRNA2_85459_c0~~gnl/TRDRNA2_/TRDRNA2_85459_c0_seq1.p1  ORF type:complete len:454 (+),score=73.70 gnl/TRDRNA2_/TRDRNA2_85459_c0_seq1:89-1363(+)